MIAKLLDRKVPSRSDGHVRLRLRLREELCNLFGHRPIHEDVRYCARCWDVLP